MGCDNLDMHTEVLEYIVFFLKIELDYISMTSNCIYEGRSKLYDGINNSTSFEIPHQLQNAVCEQTDVCVWVWTVLI